MYSNKNLNKLSLKYLVMLLSDKNNIKKPASMNDDNNFDWEYCTAENIFKLSEEKGAYGMSLFNERPIHFISERVKKASELLISRMDRETNQEIYDSLAGAYKSVLDSALGNIYSRTDGKTGRDTFNTLTIVTATENILDLDNEKSPIKEAFNKLLTGPVFDNILPELKKLLIMNQYKDSIFHSNQKC